jgi:hypothetical protein
MRPISASRIKSFQTCRRRYAWEYLHNERSPSGDAAEAGSQVHKLLETGEFTGEETWKRYAVGKMAKMLQDATPKNVTSREEEFTKTVHGVDFMGRVDFQTERAVGDFKTTSSPKGMRTAAQLEDDPQRLLYVELTGKPDSVWLYGNFRTMKVTPVVIPGDAERDKRLFRLHVLQPAQELLAIPDGVDPLTLQPNTLSCGLYPPAGCPFTTRCYDASGALRMTLDTAKQINATEQLAPQTEEQYNQPTDPENNMLVPLATFPKSNRIIGTLYVDCYPVAGANNVQHAGSLIAASAKTVCEDAHVLHSQLVDFGKGAHMLAAQFKHDLLERGERFEHMFLETRSAEGKAVMFELCQLADVVVKACI